MGCRRRRGRGMRMMGLGMSREVRWKGFCSRGEGGSDRDWLACLLACLESKHYWALCEGDYVALPINRSGMSWISQNSTCMVITLMLFVFLDYHIWKSLEMLQISGPQDELN